MGYKDIERQREYQRKWMADRRKESIAQRGGTCVKCGATENLEVDHIDRTQKIDHKIWSWTEKKREAELAKCQLLCEKCHKQKTADDLARKPNEKGEYKCNKCQNYYLPSEFHKTNNKVGFYSRCKSCKNAENRFRDRRKDKSTPSLRILALKQKNARR